MKRFLRTGSIWLSLGLPAAAVACGGDGGGGSDTAETPPAEADRAVEPAPPPEAAAAAPAANPLMNPASPEMNMMAPATFRARFTTSAGDFVIDAHRDWAPNGVDRFYNLVQNGFFDDVRFFRVIEGFMAQFGIQGDPGLQSQWREASIPDDPVVESNTRGRLTFATSGPNSRTTQMFVNFGDNARLDASGFAPVAEVVEGMDVVDRLYAGYGEGAPRGLGPDQGQIQRKGNAYLDDDFPELDHIVRVEIISQDPPSGS